MRTSHRLAAVAVALLLCVCGTPAAPAAAVQPPSRYPRTPQGTMFLDHGALLGPTEDPAWFEANIPFLEVPDQQIQSVYYYRWQTYKEHLVYTGPEYGWLSNEFLQPVSYGAPYGGISAAAGHQISEGRWLRDQQYVKDVIHYWLNGPGRFPKPMVDAVNADTSDWAHEYSFWAASSVWQQLLAGGDRAFTLAQQPALIRQYDGWANHFNPALGLYWQAPVWDATEFSASSLESSDPYHGGHGYRPTINSYQYGDARAIARIASLAGDAGTAADFNARAAALQNAVQARLWDGGRQFYYGIARDGNPNLAKTGSRELMGYLPWVFGLAPAANASAFQQLLDPNGFAAAYGPTTAERRSPWFMYQAGSCCRWNGPSWPFATSQTLTALANLLQDYPAQPYVSAADYVNLLRTYAATQYKNGKPYVAEAHHPDNPTWMYDGANHSEDYNHSTYTDNVISELVGLRGKPDDTLTVRPLAPATWDYFALENTPYHGHSVTVLWDRTGGRYGQGAGLRVYVDGVLAGSQAGLGAMTVNVGAPITQSGGGGTVNIAANGQRFGYHAQPFASYTSPYDNVWNVVDGLVWRRDIPNNTRWTSYGTPNASDSVGVDFGRAVTVRDLRLWFYDDGGGVRTPGSYDLQYWTGANWATVPGQVRTPGVPTGNALNEITFPPIDTSRLRVVAPNPGGGTGWGLSEFEVWSPPVFKIFNVGSGKLLAVQNASQDDNANVQQYADSGTQDHLWELADAGGGYYKILNLGSGLQLAVQDASTTAGAQVRQFHENGTADQVWSLVDAGGGRFKVRNRNSGLLLGVAGASTADSADIVQVADSTADDRLWTFRAAAQPSRLTDDFETQSTAQWQPQSGSWSACRPVSWELCSTGTGDSVTLAGGAGWRAYTVDASIRAAANPPDSGIALLARAQDGTHYYQAELKRNGDGSQEWIIARNDGGQWATLASGRLTWPSATYLNLRFAAQGHRLTMGLMGPGGTWQTLGSATDTRYVSGRPGLRTWGLTGSFDLVHVRSG
ncbi:RICIN domain-containing protein [Sphaerisporangium sp. NPDC049002]|uniref:MGH1-like glycoside hydrolase domain-containing protein n=1 Tax=Sphaerisporangium sp. NPDC049002 TaxID=3155392 RepID=UPI0033F395FD